MNILRQAVTNERGNVSHARIIALLVAFCATAFMWKLLLLNQMTLEYFIAYITMGVVHLNVSKALDVVQSIVGRRVKDET